VTQLNVKGLAFRSLVTATQRLLGPALVEQMLPLLPEEIARAVRHNRFLTGGWYPLSQYRALHHAIARAAGDKGGPELARALGRACTHDDFRGVYRVLTFVLSPEFLMRRAPALWSRYYDGGTLEVVVAKPGFVETRHRGCSGFDRLLWEDVIGGAVGILEVCGAKELSVDVRRGGGDGDDFLDAACTWR
jgi:hypothetical protein